MGKPDLGPLTATAREVAADWGVELGSPFALARYSYVAPAGCRAVLKVTPPEDDEADEEPDALELWGGHGAVRLLRRDDRRRVMLIERVYPGADLSGLREDEATSIAVNVGLRLWRSAAEPFRWIGDHVPRWLDNAARDGHALVPLASALYASLDVARATLVHGDFHHHNLLAHGRWVGSDRPQADARRAGVRRSVVPLEPAVLPDAARRHGAASRRVRRRGARRGAHACVGGDPRCVPRGR